MIDIVHCRTGAVLYHAEVADTIAKAIKQAIVAGADLRGANLSDANLSGANLTGANLSDANLSGANLSNAKNYVLRINGSRHEIDAIDDDVRIGCMRKPLTEWLECFVEVGELQSYTPSQIAEYGSHLRHIAALLEMRSAGMEAKA